MNKLEEMKKLKFDTFKELIDESWHKDLQPFIEGEECYNIYQFLKNQPKRDTIPKSNLLWRPFKECKKQDLKVVFIGMCPYHTRVFKEDVADGLCFSTQMKKLPPSLIALLDGLKDDIKNYNLQDINDLSYLANQGILMLNAGMTTSHMKAGNHIEKWIPFHKYLYENVYNSINGLIFVYFGKEAQKLKKFETPFIHYSKSLEHPAHAARESRPFNHENVFSWINKILIGNNGQGTEIIWDKKIYDEIKELPF